MRLLLSLLVLLPSYLVAQFNVEYQISQPYKVIDAWGKSYFSIKDEQKLLSLKMNRKGYHLQLFDANSMQELKRSFVKRKDIENLYRSEYVGWFGGQMWFFYSTYDKKEQKTALLARAIDVINCRFSSDVKTILSLDYRITWEGFTPQLCNDKSRMLIQCRRVPEKKRDAINHDKIGMFVIDEELNILKGNEIEMPYTEKKMNNEDYSIDAEGTPYLLAKVYDDNSTKEIKAKKANYHIEMMKIDVESKKINATKISMKDHFLKNTWIFEGTDQQMICAGFYNKKLANGSWSFLGSSNSSGSVDGIYLLKFDEENQLIDQKFHEIPLEIINQYTSLKQQARNTKQDKKDKAELSNLVLRKLIVQDDNSVLLIGEQYYVITRVDSKGNVRYTFYYNDILVSKINAEGQLEWMRKLPKRQRGGGQTELGFKHMKLNDAHYFVFMDNEKNMELNVDQKPAYHVNGRGGFITAYEIKDESGAVSKTSIMNTKDGKEHYKLYQFAPERIVSLEEENAFLIEFYKKGKEDVMVKFKVNEN